MKKEWRHIQTTANRCLWLWQRLYVVTVLMLMLCSLMLLRLICHLTICSHWQRKPSHCSIWPTGSFLCLVFPLAASSLLSFHFCFLDTGRVTGRESLSCTHTLASLIFSSSTAHPNPNQGARQQSVSILQRVLMMARVVRVCERAWHCLGPLQPSFFPWACPRSSRHSVHFTFSQGNHFWSNEEPNRSDCCCHSAQVHCNSSSNNTSLEFCSDYTFSRNDAASYVHSPSPSNLCLSLSMLINWLLLLLVMLLSLPFFVLCSSTTVPLCATFALLLSLFIFFTSALLSLGWHRCSNFLAKTLSIWCATKFFVLHALFVLLIIILSV